MRTSCCRSRAILTSLADLSEEIVLLGFSAPLYAISAQTHLSNPIVRMGRLACFCLSPFCSPFSFVLFCFLLPRELSPLPWSCRTTLLKPRYLPFPHPASRPRLPVCNESKKEDIPSHGCHLAQIMLTSRQLQLVAFDCSLV